MNLRPPYIDRRELQMKLAMCVSPAVHIRDLTWLAR